MPPKRNEYTDETLERATTDATTFICALGAVPEIRTIMAAAGMTDDDVEEGRSLLLAALAVPKIAKTEVDTPAAKAQREAVAALDNWDEPNFKKIKSSLERHFPDVSEYVFDKLSASRGSASVKGVATLLARLDTLESGKDPARQATRAQDQAAVEYLAKRSYTKQERQRLHALVNTALGATPPLDEAPPDDAQSMRRAKLLALKLWLNEWTATAHADIKKKSYLIRLRLATRRSPQEKEDTPEEPQV